MIGQDVSGGRGVRRLLAELPTQVIDGDDGVGTLVRIDPEHDHGPVAFPG
jgi:hypothetical protein